jgi:3-hydroxymyristoyl/3-hydroxydecanoyl-(acyl carrier protein) dehydratase
VLLPFGPEWEFTSGVADPALLEQGILSATARVPKDRYPGHMKAVSIVPGVLAFEVIAQAAGLLVCYSQDGAHLRKGNLPVLKDVHGGIISAVPEDDVKVMVIEVSHEKLSRLVRAFAGIICSPDGKVHTAAVITATLKSPDGNPIRLYRPPK